MRLAARAYPPTLLAALLLASCARTAGGGRLAPPSAVSPSAVSPSAVSPPPGAARPPSVAVGVKTDLRVYPEPPAPPLPRAGGKWIDPVFGAEVMRVTDERIGASAGTSYSYWPTFNRDSTRLFVHRDGSPSGFVYEFDPETFTLGAHYEIPRLPDGRVFRGEDAVWSARDPDILFGHTDSGTKLWKFDAAARRFTAVGDLARRLRPGEYLNQMSKSESDDLFAFTWRGGPPAYAFLGCVVYQASTDAVVQRHAGPVDECQLDKTGRYLVWKTGVEGPGKIEVRILDTQTGAFTDLRDDAPDHAPGHSDNGRGFVVGASNFTNTITRRALASPRVFTRLFDFGDTWDNPFHISMLADDEGWCLVSFYGEVRQGKLAGVLKRELVMLATDGSRRVRRLAHHHSVLRGYYDSPRANVSRDGRFVAFTSNWGGRSRRDLFVARVEPAPPTRPRRAPAG